MATKPGAIYRTDYSTGGRGLRAVLNVMCLKMSNLPLPLELFDNIYYHLYPEAFERLQANRAARLELVEPHLHPALTPPSDGRCCLLGIDWYGQPLRANLSTPTEVRNDIFAYLLQLQKTVIKPRCGDSPMAPRNLCAPPKHNTTSNLMTLCKQIKEEIKVRVYDEQVFEVHVHEGIVGGGVEFLQAGRQPLHYMMDKTDMRFEKFRFDDQYGFNQMKKIRVVIFPNRTEGYTKLPMITYFMILTLTRALQQKSTKEIVSITLDFARPKEPAQPLIGRREIMSATNPWWDFKTEEPKTSVIHNLSDIELVLRPFGNLTKVHNIHINLPDHVRDHEPSAQFVRNLEAHMASDSPFDLSVPDNLDTQFEMLRNDVEEHIFRTKFGNKPCDAGKMGRLTECDMVEEVHREQTEDESDEDLDSGPANSPDSLPMGSLIVSRKRQKTSVGHQDSTNVKDDDKTHDRFESLARKPADDGEINGKSEQNSIADWRKFAQNASHPSEPSSNTRSLARVLRNPSSAPVDHARGGKGGGTRPFRHPNPSRFVHGHPTANPTYPAASPRPSGTPAYPATPSGSRSYAHQNLGSLGRSILSGVAKFGSSTISSPSGHPDLRNNEQSSTKQANSNTTERVQHGVSVSLGGPPATGSTGDDNFSSMGSTSSDFRRTCLRCREPLPPLEANRTHHCRPGLEAMSNKSPSSDVRTISRESSGSSQLAAALSGGLSLQGAGAGPQAGGFMDLSGDFTQYEDENAA